MDLGLQGKAALVLGGTGGLGSAIAATLAAEGASVALGGRNRAAGQAIVDQISADGARAAFFPWELSDVSAIEAQVAAVEAEFGPIQVLINNTGGPPATPASGQSLAQWSASFQEMVLSVIGLTDRVLPGMIAAGWGRVVTVASSGVIAPIPNLGISNTLRASLVGWSKTLAREVAPHGVTANVVVPGRVATGRTALLDERRAERERRSVEDVARDSAASIPVGRYGRPQEFAEVVAFVASERASYVTGSVIRVDGGLIASV